jgi:predicted nucleic acid-binding protein
MFLLDTNVLSALMMMQPPPEIAAWVSAQPDDLIYTAAVCQAEILAGLAILPEGRRRAELATAAQAMFLEDFAGRVLPFDTLAAQDYADMYVARRRTGRPAAALDLMIGAIARVNGASVVTRNVADFESCGVPIINPGAA